MRTLSALILLAPALAFAQNKGETPVKLTLKKLTLTTSVPASWGKGTPLPVKEEDEDAASAYVPVIDDTMEHTGIAFTKPLPKIPDADLSAVTLALATVPDKFKDDEGSTGPEEERDPFAITAAQKDSAVKKLADIYAAKAVNSADFITPEMESAPNLVGGWWGSPDAVLDILSIEYFETADGAFRGAAFFYVAGQDIHFNASYCIALYNPEAKAVILADTPVGGFKALQPFVKAVNDGHSGAEDDVVKAYAKGEAFVRDPAAWKGSDMGLFIEQLNAAVKGAALAK